MYNIRTYPGHRNTSYLPRKVFLVWFLGVQIPCQEDQEVWLNVYRDICPKFRSYSCQLGTKSDPAAWSAILPPVHTNKQNSTQLCLNMRLLGYFKAIPQCFIFEVSLLKLQKLQRLAGCKCPSQVNISSCFLAYIHAFLLQGIRWATTHFGQSSGFTGRCFGFCVRCGHDSIFARGSRRKTIVFCWKSWKPWQNSWKPFDL